MSDKKAGAAHCKRVYTLFPIQIPKKFLQNRPQLVIHPTFVIPDGPYGRLRQAQIERLRHKTDQIPGPYVPEYLHQPQRLKNPDQKFRLRHRDAVRRRQRQMCIRDSLYAFSSIPKIRRCRSSPNSWKKFCATAHILSCFPLASSVRKSA